MGEYSASGFWAPMIGLVGVCFFFWNNIDKTRRTEIKALRESLASLQKQFDKITLDMAKIQTERETLYRIVTDKDPATANFRQEMKTAAEQHRESLVQQAETTNGIAVLLADLVTVAKSWEARLQVKGKK